MVERGRVGSHPFWSDFLLSRQKEDSSWSECYYQVNVNPSAQQWKDQKRKINREVRCRSSDSLEMQSMGRLWRQKR